MMTAKPADQPAKDRKDPGALHLGVAFAASSILALMSWTVTSEFGHVAAVWPANAVIVAYLLKSSCRRWPGFLLAGVCGIAAAAFILHVKLWLAVALPLCNWVDMLIAAGGMRLALRRDPDLTQGRDVLIFVAMAGLLAPTASGLLVFALNAVHEHRASSSTFYEWYGAKSLGVLTLVPSLLAMSPGAVIALLGSGRRSRVLALFGGLTACLALVFLQSRFPLLFLVMPVLMLITFQLELVGGSAAVLITAIVAVGASISGHGPATLVRGSLTDKLMLLQVFLAIVTMSVLAAGAIRGHQRRLMDGLRAALAETEARRAATAEDHRLAQMAEEMSGVGAWRFDLQTGTRTWSPEIFKIYGLDPNAAVPSQEEAAKFHHPDDRTLVTDNLQTAISDGAPFSCEIRIIRSPGDIRQAVCRGAAERDGAGRVRTVFGALMDVTEARRQDQILRESEERFRLLAENSSDVIVQMRFAVGQEPVVLYVSPAVERVLGYPADPAEFGNVLSAYVHPDDLAALEGSHREQRLQGPNAAPRLNRYRLRHNDGRWIWIEGSPTFTFDPATGAATGMIAVLRDISAQKAADEAIRRSEARYRLLTDAAPDIITETLVDGSIIYISPVCRRITGFEPEELRGRNVFDMIADDGGPSARVRLKDVRRPEDLPDNLVTQFRAKHRSGRQLWLESKPKAIVDEQTGCVTGFIDVVRDITERKALEEKLAAALVDAEAASVAKTEFLSNMSHEIRTPLTAIMGFSTMLQDVSDLPADASLYVKRIVTGSQSLLSIVNDVLDFSKLEAGQVLLDPQPMDPKTFAADTLALVAAQAAQKGLRLGLDAQEPLPDFVEADGLRLRQIVLNLLTNAIKFTNAGRVRLKIGYAAELGRLDISVSDTGLGISEDKLQLLFKRFSQVDSSITRKYGGTGLGLAICKSLVGLMGGEIEVESEEGRGSTFSFFVPAPSCGAPAVAEDLHLITSVRAEEAGPPSSPSILIVDDLAENRELSKIMLQAAGCRTMEAAGGAEAVALASEAVFDVILMDMQMPGMDGVSAARSIRASGGLNATSPILALTASVMADQIDECIAAGMNDHIAKPIRVGDLVEKVRRWSSPQGGESERTGEKEALEGGIRPPETP